MTTTHPRITPRELKALLHDGKELALLDVREAGQFGAAHLLFATPLPYSRLELDIIALVPRKSARIVLCDDGHANLADVAAKRLSAIGYTDIALLEGGTAGWAVAGYTLFAGVNVPSKLFGELVEHEYQTPRVSVTELAQMKESGENYVIVDGRPFAEYHKMNIPGGICCPNAELPYRIGEIVRNPATKIIVNCAGRTRSIMGAQTLINFGIANPVYALENGTQGWVLADMVLERGASQRYPDHVSENDLPRLREQAQVLMQRYGITSVSGECVRGWLAADDRTTYLIDVRTEEEFECGSIPGATHAPGGQLIQATDQWVGIRNGRIVLIDSEGVRAPVVASWLKQLGCDVYVLEGGTHAQVAATVTSLPKLPMLISIDVGELKRMVDRGECTIFDLRASMAFRKAHVTCSRWSIRPRLVADAQNAAGTIVLVADDDDVARVAAIDLREAGMQGAKVLAGGLDAWMSAGYSTASSNNMPADHEAIDYLFFVHDRHAGNRDAMRQYLAWETGLIAQLDADDRQLFKVGTLQSAKHRPSSSSPSSPTA